MLQQLTPTNLMMLTSLLELSNHVVDLDIQGTRRREMEIEQDEQIIAR